MRIRSLLFAAVLGILLASCDHGLDPALADSDPGFGGTVRVDGAWPPEDSVRQLRVVAFRNYPPSDILAEVLGGTAVYSDELPYGETEIVYTQQDESLNGAFQYVVVAQNYGDDLFADWQVVGVYTRSGNVEEPSPIDLGAGSYVGDVDISVDFYDLPPQPF